MMMNQTTAETAPPIVGLIMGSESDWKTMRPAADILESLGIQCDKKVVSAHRTPDDLFKYAEQAEMRGLKLIIAGAGGAAHLPGMTAAKTIVPVIGVPVIATPLAGFDALLSIMQMPAGVGVATVRVGSQGAAHAALFAASILAREDEKLYGKLRGMRDDREIAPKAASSIRNLGSVPGVAIFVERDQDLELMQHAEAPFLTLKIPFTRQVVSPSASIHELSHLTRTAQEEGTAVFIAGSGGGISLACKLARTTMLPVLGVPIVSDPIDSIDKFVQPFLELPSGVATLAIGRPGAINAALFAATILSPDGSWGLNYLREMRVEQANRVRAMKI